MLGFSEFRICEIENVEAELETVDGFSDSRILVMSSSSDVTSDSVSGP